MKISDDMTLRELQTAFRAEFPFLKLKFFSQPNETGNIYRLNETHLIGQVSSTHAHGYIKLDPHLTASAIEQTFQDIFGLNVRVYRKSFGQWVQTWPSDNWTLREQNLRSMLTEERAVIV